MNKKFRDEVRNGIRDDKVCHECHPTVRQEVGNEVEFGIWHLLEHEIRFGLYNKVCDELRIEKILI